MARDNDRLSRQVKNLHLEGISVTRDTESPKDVVNIVLKLRYFTTCCGELHEQQDAVETVIHLFAKEEE